MNISVSDEMHDYITRRARLTGHITVSEYIRSLVRRDQSESREESAVPKPVAPLRTANDVMSSFDI